MGAATDVGDVFVQNLATGVITRASTGTDGAGGNSRSFEPSLSADGTRVAFFSAASNLVPGDTNSRTDLFVKDLRTGAISRASTTSAGAERSASPTCTAITP